MEILEHFMSKKPGTQLTLSDLIINKIKENDEKVSAGKFFFLFLFVSLFCSI